MYHHEPESPLFRVSVAMRPGGTQFGTMPAHEGMALAYGGTIVRVSKKSIIVRNGQLETRETAPYSITADEATRFGFPRGCRPVGAR
jgi:hypothetical protein